MLAAEASKNFVRVNRFDLLDRGCISRRRKNLSRKERKVRKEMEDA